MAKKRIQITLKKNILDMLVKEAIKENLSKSELLEKILDEHYNTDRNKLNEDIRKNLDLVMKPYIDRLARILAKTTKISYASEYLALKMYSYLTMNENDVRFLEESKEDAERSAYNALKNGAIETDIETLFNKEKIKENLRLWKEEYNNIAKENLENMVKE